MLRLQKQWSDSQFRSRVVGTPTSLLSESLTRPGVTRPLRHCDTELDGFKLRGKDSELSCFLCNMMCRLGTPVVGPGPGRRGGADPGGGGAAAGAIIMIARRAPGRAVKPSESSGPPGPNRDSVRRTSRISDYRPGPAREPPPARAGPPGPTAGELSLRVRVTAHVLSQDESLAPT